MTARMTLQNANCTTHGSLVLALGRVSGTRLAISAATALEAVLRACAVASIAGSAAVVCHGDAVVRVAALSECAARVVTAVEGWHMVVSKEAVDSVVVVVWLLTCRDAEQRGGTGSKEAKFHYVYYYFVKKK